MIAIFSLLAQVASQDAPARVEDSTPIYSWFPEAVSTHAHAVDQPFYFIMAVCVAFFVLIVGLMAFFVIKYRRKDESEPIGQGATHHLPLELTWTILPLLIALVMFFWGVEGQAAMKNAPANSYEVHTLASRWSWDFRYHNQVTHNELHGWVGQPLKVICRSTDVLHAFFVPVMRTKVDIVPGRYSEAWFEPIRAGKYRLTCAEYCGTEHSTMNTWCIIHETRADFDEWLKDAGTRGERTPLEWGEILYTRKGCNSCHVTGKDDRIGQGPNWFETSQLYHSKSKRQFTDGTSQLVDSNYLRVSMQRPHDKVVQTFADVMTFKKLSDDDIDSLIAFITSLSKKPKN